MKRHLKDWEEIVSIQISVKGLMLKIETCSLRKGEPYLKKKKKKDQIFKYTFHKRISKWSINI